MFYKKIILFFFILFLLCSCKYINKFDGGIIEGTIVNPDATPAVGINVKIEYANENHKSLITESIVSDENGKYRIENLVPGKYKISVEESAQIEKFIPCMANTVSTVGLFSIVKNGSACGRVLLDNSPTNNGGLTVIATSGDTNYEAVTNDDGIFNFSKLSADFEYSFYLKINYPLYNLRKDGEIYKVEANKALNIGNFDFSSATFFSIYASDDNISFSHQLISNSLNPFQINTLSAQSFDTCDYKLSDYMWAISCMTFYKGVDYGVSFKITLPMLNGPFYNYIEDNSNS